MTTKNEGFNAYQTIDIIHKDHTDNQSEEISLEVSNGIVDLMLETTDVYGDEKFVAVHLDRDQLWEHVHNCLWAMEGMK